MNTLNNKVTGYRLGNKPLVGGGCNLCAPVTNLQNIKAKHTAQPTKKKSANPYRIHVLPLLKHRG
jgi:hypothetical protein